MYQILLLPTVYIGMMFLHMFYSNAISFLLHLLYSLQWFKGLENFITSPKYFFAAALHGDGTYFAVNAKYSASDKYSKPDPQGQKYMYLCRVLTGDFITGTLGMKVPPTKSTTSIHLYDSVTDSVSPPSMFIIFHDSQAYPEYLITFK